MKKIILGSLPTPEGSVRAPGSHQDFAESKNIAYLSCWVCFSDKKSLVTLGSMGYSRPAPKQLRVNTWDVPKKRALPSNGYSETNMMTILG